MKKIEINEDELIKLLISGYSTKEISNILNVNIQVVQRRIKKIKLPDEVSIKFRPSNKEFNQEELDVIIGGLVGDTWIGFFKESKNACGSFTHKIEHEEYTYFKYNYLKRLCASPTIHNKFDKRSNRKYQQSFCKIRTNPLLNDIQRAFYTNGRKTINEEYILKLSPLGIAIWFMDDGSKATNGYYFHTNCFNEDEIKILQKLLLKFDIKSNFHDNQNKVIYITSEYKDSFTNLISHYIPKCMEYKLHKMSS